MTFIWRAAADVEGWEAPNLDQALDSLLLPAVEGTVRLCKQQPVISWHQLPQKHWSLCQRAPLCHLEVLSKRKKQEGIFFTPPQVYMLQQNYTNVKAGAREVMAFLSASVCLFMSPCRAQG